MVTSRTVDSAVQSFAGSIRQLHFLNPQAGRNHMPLCQKLKISLSLMHPSLCLLRRPFTHVQGQLAFASINPTRNDILPTMASLSSKAALQSESNHIQSIHNTKQGLDHNVSMNTPSPKSTENGAPRRMPVEVHSMHDQESYSIETQAAICSPRSKWVIGVITTINGVIIA